MTINGLMNIGRNAMGAYRGAMDVASQNASNAGVEGYSRRRGDLTSLGLGKDRRVSAGVMFNSPRRIIDQFSADSARSSGADAALARGRATALGQIEALVAPLEGGLGVRMDELMDAFSRLSSQPGGVAERDGVLYAAEALVDEFQSTRSNLDKLQAPLTGLAQAQISDINELSAQVAALNEGIRSAEAGQGEASELRDQRDRLLDKLTELSGADVLELRDGTVTVSLQDGSALVSGENASTLSSVKQDGELVLEITSASGTTRSVRSNAAGGELQGVLEARNKDVGGAITALDELAFGVSTAINDLHVQGLGLDGVSGRPFFEDLTQAEGAAAALELSVELVDNPDGIAATRDPNQLPGGSDLILELAEISDTPLSGLGGLSAAESIANLQTGIGRKLNRANADMRSSEAQAETFSNIRESTRGVSLDEELADMLRHQRGFEAASRVIRTADELMQTIIGMV